MRSRSQDLRVDDAVAVAFEIAPRLAGRFGVLAATALLGAAGENGKAVGGQHFAQRFSAFDGRRRSDFDRSFDRLSRFRRFRFGARCHRPLPHAE